MSTTFLLAMVIVSSSTPTAPAALQATPPLEAARSVRIWRSVYVAPNSSTMRTPKQSSKQKSSTKPLLPPVSNQTLSAVIANSAYAEAQFRASVHSGEIGPASLAQIDTSFMIERRSISARSAVVIRESELMGLVALGPDHLNDAVVVLDCPQWGIERAESTTAWLQLEAWVVVPSTMSVRGPFQATGSVNANSMWLPLAKKVPEATIMEHASQEAAAALWRTLQTGIEAPLSDLGKVGFSRTRSAGWQVQISDTITGEKANALSKVRSRIERQSDAFFYPELPPGCEIIQSSQFETQSFDAGVGASDLWNVNNLPDLERASKACLRAGIRYLFLTRIVALELEETSNPSDIAGPSERRADAIVEGMLYDVRSHSIRWKAAAEGGTISRREIIRALPRIRSLEQVSVDAVHTAFGHLRSVFSDWRRGR